ncbi:MAG: IPTL-CTERM sorting domain-containing protein [Thermodesulfobacteriota bacterium]
MFKLTCCTSVAKIYLILLTMFIFSVTPALAQVNFTFDEAEFLAQNPNLQFQNFLGTFVAPGDLLVCDDVVDSSTNDDCFTPGQILPGLVFQAKPQGLGPAEIILVGSDFFGNANPTNALIANQFGSGLDILFLTPDTNAVGITAGCLLEFEPCTPRNMSVSVFGENGLIGTTNLLVSDAFDSFLGITSTEPIVEILLDNEIPMSGDFQNGLLDLRFGTRVLEINIPTLSEWGMIAAAGGLGLAGVWFAVRKRKRSTMQDA